MSELPGQLRKQYDLRFAGTDGYRNQVWQILCQEYFSRYIPVDATILDVGAGWGEFINNISARNKFAMDLNPTTGERLAENVTFFQQDCSVKWPFPSGVIDVVFTSNFLEHLPNKDCLQRTFDEAKRCLKKGGLLICMGPNMRCLPGAYWDFWDHNIPLTELSIAELMRLKELSVEDCISRFLPYSMSSGSQPPLIFVKLYLKIPIVWKYFGKQFLVVGRNL